MSSSHAVVAALLLAALAAACSPAPERPPAPGGTVTPSPTVSAPATGTPAPPAATPTPGGGVSRPRATSAPLPERPPDGGGLGAMCRHYLGGRAPRVVLEVDWQPGAEPTAAAVAHLRAVLQDVLRPPGGVVLAGGTQVAGERDTWSSGDVRALAAATRGNWSSREQLTMHVLSLAGTYSEEGTLGLAYSASAFAMFPDEMRGLSTLLGGRAALERSVLVHEAGHLLCLVNIGYTSPFDREDPEHRHHSRDRASVMHWAVDTSAVGRIFNGPPPDDFTAQDREDLRRLGSGQV